ncbi:MAG TPA: AEC family transporter [Candidatus Ratteibacteria bacterium]|nr:AEC family transporter [Candidatus Ratteibacteria bacterium]
MFFHIFTRILSIFLIIFAGTAARKLLVLTDNAISSMARCITNFFYPALIISSITSNFTVKSLISNWTLPVGTVLIMITGYFIGILFSRFLEFESEKQKNTFLFQCTINNYVFLPLPIIAMLYGSKGVGFLIFSSLGSEISVWTIGILGLTGNHIGKKNLKNLINAPIFALIFSILIVFIRDNFGASQILTNSILKEILLSINSAIDIFGQASVPLALFTAGGRIYNISMKHIKTRAQLWTDFLRLILIPAAAACAILTVLPVSYEVFMVLAIVSVMPAAIVSIILSETYDADTYFASSTVLTTHLFSLLTIPCWLTFLMNC